MGLRRIVGFAIPTLKRGANYHRAFYGAGDGLRVGGLAAECSTMTSVTTPATHDPTLLVHGGAWAIPADAAEAHEAGVRAALEAGYAILSLGGSAIDAVQASVQVLEDDPTFDARAWELFDF